MRVEDRGNNHPRHERARMSHMEWKNDPYRQARGGYARLLAVSCATCGTHLFSYQKDGRCSSATTLIMNRFKFGGQKLSKCPDMIRQSGGHARSSVAPLELNQARGVWLLLRQRQAQAHVRPGKIVEGLQEDHAPSHLSTILTCNDLITSERLLDYITGFGLN